MIGLSAVIFSGCLFAQTPMEKQVVVNFQQDFNTAAYEKIYQQFSTEMQKALPITMLKDVSEGLKNQLGQIKDIHFIENKGASTAIYRAEFDKDRLKMTVSLNDQGQISGLLFSPYVESSAASNTTENHIHSYPKHIANKIFTATRTFPEKTQIAIAVIEPEKTEYFGVYKHNNKVQNSKNEQQIFGIGSISKVLTSTVLAELVVQNKLKLEDSINHYYPFTFKENIQLRFKDLANHTSGLPRLPSNADILSLENPYEVYDVIRLEHYLKDDLVLEKPDNQGKSPSYSNLAVGLLGHSLGLSQQKSFSDLLQNYVFDQYDMKNTYTSSSQVENNLVPALNEKGEVIPTWEFDTMLGAGGILSSVEDLAHFAQAQLDVKNLAIQMTQQSTTEKVANYQMGLGWFIRENDDAKKILWHGGNTAGHTSILIVDLKKKKAVTILANVSVSHPEMSNIENLAIELLN